MPPKELPTQPNGGDRVAVWNKWEQWLKDSPRIIQKLEYMQPELSAGLAGQIVLERWLESKPEIINELCSELSKRKGHKRLRSRFRNYFEKPSEDFFDEWETTCDKVLNDIQWDSFSHEIPELISSSQAAVNTFRRFLIAWALLQIEVREAKTCLKTIFENVFAPLYKEGIMKLIFI